MAAARLRVYWPDTGWAGAKKADGTQSTGGHGDRRFGFCGGAGIQADFDEYASCRCATDTDGMSALVYTVVRPTDQVVYRATADPADEVLVLWRKWPASPVIPCMGVGRVG